MIGASDYLPNTIWLKLFMEAQGHKMSEIVYCEQRSQNRHNVPQDNTSKIINVPTCVPIVPQEEQYKENQQQQGWIH